MPLLEIRNLQRLHLSPINLEIESGQCLCIIGESGTGKSQILRAIADLDPHSGEMYLKTQAGIQKASEIPAPKWREQICYIPAESSWWAKIVGEHFQSDRENVEKNLLKLGLEKDILNAQISHCSTGQKQRLALIRAITPQSMVLLLDEPTSGLDEQNTEKVELLLKDFLQTGGAIIMVTHSKNQAKRMGAKVATLEWGKLAINQNL